MAELSDLLPMSPQFGPPLPGSFKVLWPWLKKPPEREYVLPIVEAPKLVTAPAPEPAPQPQPVPAATQRTINYEIESPPEILSPGTPTRISPGWIRI